MEETTITTLETSSPMESQVMVKYKERNYLTTIINENAVNTMFLNWLDAVKKLQQPVVIGKLPDKPIAALVPFEDYLEMRRHKELAELLGSDE